MFAAIAPFLARLPLDRLRRLVTPRAARASAPHELIDRTIRFVEAARTLGRPIVDPGCLTRGLTLYYFLRRAGLDVVLCFGVGYNDGGLIGHCWLERDGEPFLEPVLAQHRYTEMYRFPARRTGGPPLLGAGPTCVSR